MQPTPELKTMDPDCAICSQPALARCDCESKALDHAIRQAESRMMENHFSHIRNWVRGHAQDYILSYYEVLTTRRRETHTQHMAALTSHYARVYRTHPHPAEIARAEAALKRGIDEDWKHSVQRYPEVLEYYYSLVDMVLPNEEDANVRDPPLSALSGARKARLRERDRERREDAAGRTPVVQRRPERRGVPWAGPGSGYN
jgi:membrane-bound lytic murein transglycosylase